MADKKPKSKKAVKFLLAPRPQRDPLAADYEAPQNILVPKDGKDLDEIKEILPDFDPQVFASKGETKKGMLERAHNADGLTFDPDILTAMSKDFDFENPDNVLDDDFMDQAGGLIEDEGEMLEEDMDELTKELFEDDPEIIMFNDEDTKDPSESYDRDSDDYDLDQDCSEFNGDVDKPSGQPSFGKKLILFKKKANKEPLKASEEIRRQSARQLQDELNAHFRPENQRIQAIRQLQMNREDDGDFDIESEQDDDNRTVFTNYSMTSSVMRRSEGLQQIDEHFERLYEKEYADETEIGPLDLNEVKGDQLLSNIDQIRQLKNEVKVARMRNHGDDYQPEIVSDHHKNAIIGDEPNAEDEDLVEVEVKRRENRVDCESILTYNSNLYNHPKLIVEPRRRTNTRSTVDEMDTEDQTDVRSRSDIAQSVASTRASIVSRLSIRPTNETSEDRRARKKALKAYRQERRQERKQNQQIFKSEQANLMKQQRTNMPALKLS